MSSRFPSFPAAAQPDVLRASQKDDLYQAFLYDACYGAVREVLGTRTAVHWQSEVKLIANLMYYGLTTGYRLQTLGEEYCDIQQVTGPSSTPPLLSQRIALVLLHATGPQVVDRLSTQAASWGTRLRLASAHLRDVHDAETTSSNNVGSNDSSNNDVGSNGISNGVDVDAQRAASSSAASTSGSSTTSSLRRLHRWLRYFAIGWLTRALPYSQEIVQQILRLHLALFYFQGVYYHVSKRLTGIRYIFTGKLLETRPSYQILGVFLMLQMSVMGLLWARQHVLPAVAQPLGFSQPQPTGKGVLVLDSDGQLLEEDESIDSKEGEKDASEHRKCTLCLSIRQSTTATPCGHLFCWYCIAEWCNTKPECPLCRAPITQSALIRVYHTDL